MDANRHNRKAKRLIALAGFFLAGAILATVLAAVHWETLQKMVPEERTTARITDLAPQEAVNALAEQIRETFQVNAIINVKVLRSGSKTLTVNLSTTADHLQGAQGSIHADALARFVKSKAAWMSEVDLLEIQRQGGNRELFFVSTLGPWMAPGHSDAPKQ